MAGWIVGLALSTWQNEGPITGRTGRRLAAWSGLGGDVERLHQTFRCENLLEGILYPGETPNRSKMEIKASQLRPVMNDGDVVIMLGRPVAKAFGLRSKGAWCIWQNTSLGAHPRGSALCLNIPNPSDATHWYNDRHQLARAEHALRCAVSMITDDHAHACKLG